MSKHNEEPYKYVVVATKNIPDIPPTVADVIRPAVTPGYSTIVLIQNGLNIEIPILKAFPHNTILCGVSFCDSHQHSPAEIVQSSHDELYIGAFRNPTLDPAAEDLEAQVFCEVYAAGGKCSAIFDDNVGWTRWRKLLYNACLNPTCAITDLDTGRMRLAEGTLDGLIRPLMQEIRAAAHACGYDLPKALVETMITMDPITMYGTPSMQVDIRNVWCSGRGLSAWERH